MKNLIVLLLIMIVATACYSQKNLLDRPNEAAPALEDYLYLVKAAGGTTSDRNTTKQQFQQNLFDSLGVVRAVIALQQIEIDDNTDSIVSNEARITANESQIITNGVNISSNSIDIIALQSDVSDLEDSIVNNEARIEALETAGGGTGGDSIFMFIFGAGASNPGDTALFTTSTIPGSFKNTSSDTIYITAIDGILQGTTPSVDVDVLWNTTFSSGSATHLNNTPPTFTSTNTGDTDTSFDNFKIPPGYRCWCKFPTITTKPTYLEVTMTGYYKR